MRNLQHHWGFAWLLLLEAIGLEEMVVVESVAFVFIQMFFGSENEYLAVGLVMWRLPEGEEAGLGLPFSLDLLLRFGDLRPLELHVDQDLRQIVLDVIQTINFTDV